MPKMKLEKSFCYNCRRPMVKSGLGLEWNHTQLPMEPIPLHKRYFASAPLEEDLEFAPANGPDDSGRCKYPSKFDSPKTPSSFCYNCRRPMMWSESSQHWEHKHQVDLSRTDSEWIDADGPMDSGKCKFSPTFNQISKRPAAGICYNCHRPMIWRESLKQWQHKLGVATRAEDLEMVDMIEADSPENFGHCQYPPMPDVVTQGKTWDQIHQAEYDKIKSSGRFESAPKKAPDHLESGAETYRERNKTYGDSYHKFGKVMHALFPDGLKIGEPNFPNSSIIDWNRLGVLTQIISKLCRYSNDFDNPHRDSIHDIMVYASMLMELEDESNG